ncbi:aldehyde dehydrogenase family protein, partial [Amycolatopsis kentuckyensis]|uniref:aldehyde dehydrogenase family protein n=1 Tax=Amycolatopsis kentuckyensis TaxID=218823 RepID=UPI001178AFB8
MSASTESGVVEAVGKELFIGGKWVAAQDGKTFPVVDPATGKELCQVADASPSDGLAALDAAVAAQADFAKMAPRERGEILRRAYELLMQRQEELAL